MKSLPLMLCVVALLGAAASTALYLRSVDSRKILEAQLGASRARAHTLDRKLADAVAQHRSLEERLTALDRDLGETKSRLTTADARAIQLSRELAQTRNLVAAHDQAEHLLGGQIESLKHDLADARAAAVPPGTIDAYKATIADLERQLANAQNGAAAPTAFGASTAVFATRAPADARTPISELRSPTRQSPPPAHAVLSVGPSNAFVILNYGANHGARSGQTLDILRGTEPVASVLISDVRPNFSVAQVHPDSLRGVLHKGDPAVLTN